MRLVEVDVASPGPGIPWAHKRSYSNQQPTSINPGNGYNWTCSDWPRIAPSQLARTDSVLVKDVTNLTYYSSSEGTTTVQIGVFRNRSQLEELSDQCVVRDPDGTVWEFEGLGQGSRPGGLQRVTAPGGTVLEVTQTSGTQIIETQRTTTDGTDTVTISFLYAYFESGPSAGLLSQCLLRRRVNAGEWSGIARADYLYYSDADPQGAAGDLKSVTRANFVNGNWETLGTSYYRYYTSHERHLIKFVCDPAAYAKVVAAWGNPDHVTDGQLATYANNYFEYDSQERVTLERVDAGSLTIQYAYARNPRYVNGSSSTSSSSAEPDLNTWIFKTTEIQPDGTENVVYANYAGQTMLYITRSPTAGEWCQFFRYDSMGQVVLQARPAAISGYSEALDDLLGYDSDTETFTYLRDSLGYIERIEYFPYGENTPTTPPSGYLKNRKIQSGQLGDLIPLEAWEYGAHSAADTTVYPVIKHTLFPDAADPDVRLETTYSPSYYSDSVQVEQLITLLPAVLTSQNGSGTANQRKEYFDRDGQLTWSMDERGFLTKSTFDLISGALIQRIDDVDTASVSGAPSGWHTPSGGGLNLVTDYTVDDQGRTTQVLGPAHTISLGGSATTVRSATWTVYADSEQTVRTGRGYATESAETLINPVAITQTDPDGRVLAEIEATRASTAGKLLPSDGFPRATYTRWTTYQYTDCCLLASLRTYHVIPASGIGERGVNYDQTDYGYDSRKRRNRVVSPGGTITLSVFDARNLVLTQSVGTDDSATPDNNMVLVISNQYDGGAAGGDGNLTQQTLHIDGTATRVTLLAYDFRSRVTAIDGEADYFERRYYDNLDRLIAVERYAGPAGDMVARQETKFDSLGRVYQTIRFEVNGGSTGNSLVSNNWYDATGNLAKSWRAGSQLWTKTSYDGIGRQTVQYLGYGADATYAEIFSVAADVILQQVEFTYDAASNLIATTQRQRYHNAPASQLGPLETPTSNPKARVSFTATYPDALGRTQAVANSGTNGGATFNRPTSVPSSSATVLVTTQLYDEAGHLSSVIDPAGMVTAFTYDQAGRRLQTTENVSSSGSSSASLCTASADQNRETSVTYNAEGHIATLTARNEATGDQVTTYTYGTTLADSAVASSLLLRQVTYPDSLQAEDVVTYSYNRLGERTSLTDQNGSVHVLDYDGLGRITQDRVTTLAAGIDGRVRRLEVSYDARGLVQRISSFDNPAVGSGNTVNEVKFAYNGFGQSITAWQAHAGAVDTMSTPKVQYTFANGSANTVRPTGLVYPHGRTLTYSYGSGSGMDDSASRVAAIIDSDGSSTHLADYSYLGLETVAEQASPQPGTLTTLLGSLSADGDIYTALDRFGRLRQSLWKQGTTVLSEIRYTYNQASSRTSRQNATPNGNLFDWAYGYDGLQRLKQGERGTWSGSTVTNRQFAQCWTLDATGNWQGFRQDNTGNGTWDLLQDRESNPVNEIVNLITTVGTPWQTPQYDRNGNMLSVPTGQAPQGLNWATFTADEWDVFTADEWAGLIVGTEGLTAKFDAWNRLVQVSVPSSTPGDAPVLFAEYDYDGRGYRIANKSYSGGTLSSTRHYYYSNSWQVLEERLNTDTTPDRQFVWGLRYIDDLILRDRSVSGTLDERLYALQDGNWNVTSVINSSGAVQERYEYDPYGQLTTLSPAFSLQSPVYDWETTYCGYRWDAGTALYAVRHRYYSPLLGTWLTRDPIGYALGTNLFGLVSQRPINKSDPLGLGEFCDGGDFFGTCYSFDPWKCPGIGNAYAQSLQPPVPPPPKGMCTFGFGGTNESSLNPGNTVRLHDRCRTPGKFYEGIGSSFYGSGPIFGNVNPATLLGITATEILANAERDICSSICSGKCSAVNIIGWSRGAVLAMELARRLAKGCCCQRGPTTGGRNRNPGPCLNRRPAPVYWLGLFDPVSQMPLQFDIGSGIPENVTYADVVVDNKVEIIFPVSPVTWNGNTTLVTVQVFMGHGPAGTADSTLDWMIEMGTSHGVPIAPR